MFSGAKLNIKTISRILTVVYILCLIPLLWIAWYNYPSADDFSMGYRAYSDYVASGGNVFAAVWGALYMAWYDYFNWMGYFSSTFFLSLPPSVFDERLYFIGAYIILGALSFGVIYFFRVLFVKLLNRDKHLVNIITMLTLIIMVECLPVGMARVEAIYWYCSAANYTLMFAFGLTYIGLLLSANVDKGGKRLYDIIMACIMGFIVGGGNYMTSLSVAVFAVLFAIWLFASKKDKVMLVPVVFNLVAFLLSCIAPGNSVRGDSVEGFGAIKTILISIYYVLECCLDQWTTWAVLLLIVISLPFMWKLVKGCPLSFKYPIPVLFLAYMFVAVNIAPPIYSLGNVAAGRLQALFFVQYVLVLMLSVFYMMGWLQRAMRSNEQTELSGNQNGKQQPADTVKKVSTEHRVVFLQGPLAGVLIVATALFLVLAAINIKPVPEYFTSSCAVKDIINGHAAYFRQQNFDRRKLLRDDNNLDVVLDYYAYEPDLLFFSDITTDSQDWTNNAMSRYYGKNSVVRTQRPENN